jgi:glucose/arabinose dehydrogenase
MNFSEACRLAPLESAQLSVGFCAFTIPVEIDQPRSILSNGPSTILALERGSSSIVLLEDADGDGVADSRRTLATAPDLNHGLALHDGYVYASSDQNVYRWAYTEDFGSVDPSPTLVVNNINADGQGGAPFGHRTRTIIFDGSDRLYISVGSAGNVDDDSFRSRIRRFSDLDPSNFPIDFLQGEVFADGLRNEVGLAFDTHGVLWGVENGADNLERSDLGGDITNDNPAEELNRFREEDVGRHYGYPYCWTEFLLSPGLGQGRGTAWAWPTFLANGAVTDAQCRNNYIGPVVSMQAHSAPLGITFYRWKDPNELPHGCTGGFPRSMDGFAFLAFHGSWNRDIPTGYKVIYVPMDENGEALGEPVDLLAHIAPNASWASGFRPVDVDFDSCGRLIVSSDGSRQDGAYRGSGIVRVEYQTLESSLAPGPSAPPTAINTDTVAPVPAPTIAQPPLASPTSAAKNWGYQWSVALFLLMVAGTIYT